MTTWLLDDLSTAERSNVVDFESRRHVEHPPEKIASDRVALEIRSRVDSCVLAQACARAARHVRNGLLNIDDAVRMAKAWALDPIRSNPNPDNDPPPARAA